MPTVRVLLPMHLCTLAGISGHEARIDVPPGPSVRSVLDALEARYPMLRGTIRDHSTGERRAFLRFFACEQDISHDPLDTPLPSSVASGVEPFIILGAVAGGAGSPTSRFSLRHN